MGIGLSQCLIEIVEVLPADGALAAHLQGLGTGDGQRYISHDPDGMGDILTLETVAAGDGLDQFATLIAQHQRETVQLPADDHFPAADELEDLIGRLGLIGRKHGLRMGHRGQALQNLAGHSLGRRRGQDNAGHLLQMLQLIVEPVILQVGHDGIVLAIVGSIGLLQLGDQELHFVKHSVLLQKMCL